MLNTLRTKSRKVLLGTLILIIPSFILFYGWSQVGRGPGGQGGQRVFARYRYPDDFKFGIPGWQAWRELDTRDILSGREALESQAMQALGGGQQGSQMLGQVLRDSSREAVFPLEDSAREAIELDILQDWVESRNIHVSDRELETELVRQFGNSTKQEVEQALRQQMGVTLRGYEEMVRRDMRFQRATHEPRLNAYVSDLALWQDYRRRNEQFDLDLAIFDVQQFREKIEPSDEQLQAYYEENKEDFTIGVERRYRYALLQRENAVRDLPPIDDAEIQEYFAENREDFLKPRAVKVRQIYFPLPSGLSGEAFEAATSRTLARIEAAQQALDAGRPFAEVADEFSEDPANTLDSGDKLGGLVSQWIEPEGPAAAARGAEFRRRALGLQVGQTSDRFLSTGSEYSGYFIIQITEERPPEPAPLEQVRQDVLRQLRNERQDFHMQRMREQIAGQLDEYSTIEGLAEGTGMEDGVTTWVLKTSQYLGPELGFLPQDDLSYLNETLLPGDRSPLLGDDQRVFVLELMGERGPSVPPLKEIRPLVESAYTRERAREQARAAAEALIERVEDPASLPALAQAEGVTTASLQGLTRSDMGPGAENLPEALQPGVVEVFRHTARLQAGQLTLLPLGADAESISGYAVAGVRNVQPPARENFQEEKQNLHRALSALQQRRLLEEWTRDQISEVDIRIGE